TRIETDGTHAEVTVRTPDGEHVVAARRVLREPGAGSREPGAGSRVPGMHPLRQRQAMTHMLCQVCGISTFGADFERWGERHLYVARATGGRPIGEGEHTVMAPVCLPCATESVDACPHLRKGWTAALVSYAQSWGVAGITLHQQTLKPLSLPERGLHKVPRGDPAERWTIAMREVRTLHRVTPVALSDLVTAA
ncbi:hypothetical protein ABZ136_37165, partial [Streptomyces microflavus]